MSLLGALQLGGSSLAAQQVGLEVTGNNLANSGTAGYSRQVANLTPGAARQITPNQFMGSGVTVASIDRQVNDALNASLRDAGSQLTNSQTLSDLLSRVETVYNPLGDTNLSTQVQAFFNSFSTLANNPSDAGQRAVVIQNGASLAGNLKDLRTQLLSIRDDVQAQIGQVTKQADGLVKQIADLNAQIAPAEAGGGSPNTLLDQRDQALAQLSDIMDIRAVDTGNGMVNVLAGNMPLVEGVTSRSLTTATVADPTGKLAQTNVVYADNNSPVPLTGGKLGALLSARDNQIAGSVNALDTFTNGLINAVNAVHSQGQGTSGFTSTTATTQTSDFFVPLNDPSLTVGMSSIPTNGTFQVHVKDLTTGQTTTTQIKVTLAGNGTLTNMMSLSTDLMNAGLTVGFDSTNHMTLGANANTSFTFSDDTSGVLASLGLNTFFCGKNAQDIAVNSTLAANVDLLASGRDNVAGSNRNAQTLAQTYSAANPTLNGVSLQDYYANYIADLSTQTKAVTDDAKAQGIVKDSLAAQQQAYSGVSVDEEAINLTKYQRAFQGTSRYINVINQMMDEVLNLVK